MPAPLLVAVLLVSVVPVVIGVVAYLVTGNRVLVEAVVSWGELQLRDNSIPSTKGKSYVYQCASCLA